MEIVGGFGAVFHFFAGDVAQGETISGMSFNFVFEEEGMVFVMFGQGIKLAADEEIVSGLDEIASFIDHDIERGGSQIRRAHWR